MTEYVAPNRKGRRSYKQLFAAVVAASGEWVRVSLDDISGSTNTTKRSVVHQTAYQKGLDFQTSIVDGFIYVRMRNNNGNAHDMGRDHQAVAFKSLEAPMGT
jgi:hypothetical protein